MPDKIVFEVKGLDVLARNMDKFGKEITKLGYYTRADVARTILDTPGLRRYPAATAANAPGRIKTVTFSTGKTVNFRMAYYIRGRGLMVPTRGGGWKQTGSSERYGTQYGTRIVPPYNVAIFNRASYGHWLAGDDQAKAMAAIGWRKLYDVAVEKIGEITEIYQGWIDRIIRKFNLS